MLGETNTNFSVCPGLKDTLIISRNEDVIIWISSFKNVVMYEFEEPSSPSCLYSSLSEVKAYWHVLQKYWIVGNTGFTIKMRKPEARESYSWCPALPWSNILCIFSTGFCLVVLDFSSVYIWTPVYFYVYSDLLNESMLSISWVWEMKTPLSFLELFLTAPHLPHYYNCLLSYRP